MNKNDWNSNKAFSICFIASIVGFVIYSLASNIKITHEKYYYGTEDESE